jgi:microcystin-dependent protein
MLAATTPVGVILDFAGVTAPSGWVLADGTLYQVTQMPALFAVIGARFGGNGTTTFAVPDTRARALVGVGQSSDGYGQVFNYAIAQRGGNNGAVIAQAHLPNYQLPETADGSHIHPNGYTDAQGDHAHTGYTDQQGTHQHGTNAAYVGQSGANWFIVGSGGTPIFNSNIPTTYDGAHTHNIQTYNSGPHQHNVITAYGGGHYHAPYLGGSGQLLQIVTMYLACTKIIYAGPPPAGAVQLAAPLTQQLLAAPLRGQY